MLNRLQSETYIKQIDEIGASGLNWDKLKDKTLVVSGATGMIGCFLIDVIMRKNQKANLHCHVVALGCNSAKAHDRLPYFDREDFSFKALNIASENLDLASRADYVIHLASTTHPRAYATDPIGTIQVNVDGLKNMLEYASNCDARLLFASSVEIYGENRGDAEYFDEKYCGYVDCNTMRACYTESKRLCEAMCQAYIAQKHVDAVIARVARAYGPTLLADDSKALSQFLHKALNGEDVVLKSAGQQRYSYLYVADVVSGLLSILMKGRTGEAYNLADKNSDTSLRDLASLVASSGHVKVVFELPDAVEAAGYSKASLALMDGAKAQRELGWKSHFDLEQGIRSTLSLLSELQ